MVAIDPEAIRREASRVLQQRAIQQALTVGGSSAAAAFGLRGLLGLASQVKRNLNPQSYDTPYATVIPMPVDVTEQDKLRKKRASFLDFMKGDHASTVAGIPWATPLIAGAAPVGAMAGYSIADWISDKMRMRALDKELEAEEGKFRQALHQPEPGEQRDKLAAALDRLEPHVKAGASLTDMLGGSVGLYGTYAALSGLLAGEAAFGAVRKRQRGAMLREALERRRAMQGARKPMTILVGDGPGIDDEEEGNVI